LGHKTYDDIFRTSPRSKSHLFQSAWQAGGSTGQAGQAEALSKKMGDAVKLKIDD